MKKNHLSVVKSLSLEQMAKSLAGIYKVEGAAIILMEKNRMRVSAVGVSPQFLQDGLCKAIAHNIKNIYYEDNIDS